MKADSSTRSHDVSTRRPEPRSLDPAMRELLAPLLKVGGLPGAWRLQQIDVDQGVTLLLVGPGTPLLVELDRRDETRPCFARTQLFNVYYSEVQGLRGRLGADEQAILAAIVQCLVHGEGALQPALDLAAERLTIRSQVREITVEQVLMRDEQSSWYINPYVGCSLGCCFCFASHRGAWSRSLQGAPDVAWGAWIDVKVNAAEVLALEVQSAQAGVVRMSPVITDPYLGLERKYHITRQCLTVLQPTDFAPMILTRSPLVLRDIDVLRRCRQARIGFSVPTEDDAVRRAVEPGAPPIAQRIEALETLKAQGFETFAMVRPILLRDAKALAELLAPVVTVVEIGPLQEKPRIEAQLRGIHHLAPLDDAWQQEQAQELERHLLAAGVRVNPREPPWCNT